MTKHRITLMSMDEIRFSRLRLNCSCMGTLELATLLLFRLTCWMISYVVKDIVENGNKTAKEVFGCFCFWHNLSSVEKG